MGSKNIELKTVGKRIRKLRRDAELTQKELAEILVIASSTMASYETDRVQIPHTVLISLAKYFEVSTDYLLGLKEY